MIYQFQGNIQDALQSWADVDTDLAFVKTFELLQNHCKLKELFYKYAKKCFLHDSRNALVLFKQMKYDILTPEEIVEYLQIIQSDPKIKPGVSLVIQFLQEFLDDHPESQNKLFDDLANEYLYELFRIKNKDEETETPVKMEFKDYFDLLLEKFRTFLNQNTRYDVSKILLKMKDTWMLQE